MKKLILLLILFLFVIGCSTNESNTQTKSIGKIVKEIGKTPKFSKYEKPPIPIKQVPPKYPDVSRNAGIEGSVTLEVEIFADGTIGAIEVAKSLMSGSNGLDEAAVNAVRKWKFSPALKDGKPVAVWIMFDVNFVLN